VLSDPGRLIEAATITKQGRYLSIKLRDETLYDTDIVKASIHKIIKEPV
jgi:hypothetical protein